jgi:hypothetical protein
MMNSRLLLATTASLSLGLLFAAYPPPTHAEQYAQIGTAENNGADGYNSGLVPASAGVTGDTVSAGQQYNNEELRLLLGPQMIKGGVSNYDQYRRPQLGLPVQAASTRPAYDSHGPYIAHWRGPLAGPDNWAALALRGY